MPGRSQFELARVLAMIALGGATIFQLVGMETRSFRRESVDTSRQPSAAEAADVVVSELRRTEGSGLLAASERSIVLRVPAAVGVVCAAGVAETLIAVLPSDAGSRRPPARRPGDAAPERRRPEAARPDPRGPGRAGFGWHDESGAFAIRDARVELRPVEPTACNTSAVAAPEGSLFLAVSPAAPGARVGGPAVLFDRVEYEFRAAAGGAGLMALWRTAGGESRELLAPVDPRAGFRFYVDAASSPVATVPAPLTRVRGVELSLPGTSGERGAALIATATAVFFRPNAS